MVRDYTDFLLFIFDSGERVYHLVHLRNRKGLELNGRTYPLNGHKYLLNLDRAYRIKWAPWKKFDWSKTKWSLNELTRTKKIGILFYQEPCNHRCSKCPDKDGSKCSQVPEKIEPMHISRIHQPSGVLRG